MKLPPGVSVSGGELGQVTASITQVNIIELKNTKKKDFVICSLMIFFRFLMVIIVLKSLK